MMVKITVHTQLNVFQHAVQTAMEIYTASKSFPKEETYSLTDQMRRSSRSVCANIAEGWRKRRYPAAFIAKLNDAEAEAAETQVWLDFASSCGYMPVEVTAVLKARYDGILRSLVGMITHAETWVIGGEQPSHSTEKG